MSKTPKSINLESVNKQFIEEIFHEFGFPNFSRTVNAILTAVRINPIIKRELKQHLRGIKDGNL